MKNRNLSGVSAGSSLLRVALGLPVAVAMGFGLSSAAVAEAIDPAKAPFTESELEPYEEAIEESLPPALEDEPGLEFNVWSENEYDVFASDDFAVNESYETDVFDEQPGPLNGDYEVYYPDDLDNGFVNTDPFNTGERGDELNVYEENDLYDDDTDDLYDTFEGLGNDHYEIDDSE